MAASVDGIDIVLGGHDHEILDVMVNQIPVIKSGDDFNNLGVIQVFKKDSN